MCMCVCCAEAGQEYWFKQLFLFRQLKREAVSTLTEAFFKKLVEIEQVTTT